MEEHFILVSSLSDIGQSWADAIFDFASQNPLLILLFSFLLPMAEAFVPIFPLIGLVLASDALISSIWPSAIILTKIVTILLCAAGSITGALIVYLFVRNVFKVKLDRKFENSSKYMSASKFVANTNTFVATMVLSLVIIPVSVFNIAFALSDVKFYKYLTIQICSKVIMVTYVAILGNMIIDIKNDPVLGIIAILIFTAIVVLGYSVSKALGNNQEKQDN